MIERFFILISLTILISTFYYFNFIDVIYVWNLKSFLISVPTYFIPTLFLSILGLYIAIKNYWRKVGVNVVGFYTRYNIIYSKEPIIDKIVLINKKDKPVIIHDVIIRFGWNFHLHMTKSDENKEPIIIKPYEQYIINYDPTLIYVTSDIKIDNMSYVFDNKGKIILNTTEGKVKVKSLEKHWNPISEQLKYNNFHLIRTVNTTLDELSNIKFSIKYKHLNGNSYKLYININDHYISTPDFRIDNISKYNEIELKDIINNKISFGVIPWESFEIINVEEINKAKVNWYSREYSCSEETLISFYDFYSGYLISKVKYFRNKFIKKIKYFKN